MSALTEESLLLSGDGDDKEILIDTNQRGNPVVQAELMALRKAHPNAKTRFVSLSDLREARKKQPDLPAPDGKGGVTLADLGGDTSHSEQRVLAYFSAAKALGSRYFRERNLMLYMIFHLAIETAMRQGEILNLRWEHIDLQHGVAHLPDTKNGSSRDVPLSRKARNLLQMLPAQLNDRVFTYTSSGFKSAWRHALLALEIEDLHFHDLRHEAISRFFELGTLNVMEVAAISGHRSMNMLKRYTHLRAYQLVNKLDARRRQTQKIAPYFVPYPALVEKDEGISGGVRVMLCDFENLSVSAPTRDVALARASELLLRTLALAAQRGERVPAPGELPFREHDRIMICPLNPTQALSARA